MATTTQNLVQANAPATTAEQKVANATQQPNVTASATPTAAPAPAATPNAQTPTQQAQAQQAQQAVVNQQTQQTQQTQPTQQAIQPTQSQVRVSSSMRTTTTPTGRQSTLQDPTAMTDNLQTLLDEWRTQATGQNDQRVDYNVQRGENELRRQLEDAQPQYQEQLNQINRSEQNAKDNAALYAEMRGDKGGIGEAQYNSIQNTAAKNRLAVNQAQTKLSTDIGRQIADLRAQGEFEKADAALEVAQNYLSQLMTLQQWAAQYGITYDQFQEAMAEWQNEYNLSMANLTGVMPDGTQTYQAKQDELTRLANAASILIENGIAPSEEMLKALGLSGDEADAYLKTRQLKAAADVLKAPSGGGGGGGGNWWDEFGTREAANPNVDWAATDLAGTIVPAAGGGTPRVNF